jgi:hypothetical protein
METIHAMKGRETGMDHAVPADRCTSLPPLTTSLRQLVSFGRLLTLLYLYILANPRLQREAGWNERSGARTAWESAEFLCRPSQDLIRKIKRDEVNVNTYAGDYFFNGLVIGIIVIWVG